MNRRTPRWARRALIPAAAGILLALSGCGPTQLGAAAIVEDERITVSEVQDAVTQIRALQAQLGVSAAQPDLLARGEIQRRVLDAVFQRAAARVGVSASAGEIAQEEVRIRDQVGSPQDFLRVLAGQDLTPALVPSLYRQQVLSDKIGAALAKTTPGALTGQSRANAVGNLLAMTAQSMRVKINPRYGTFNPTSGAIEPYRPDYLSGSASAAGARPGN